MRVLRLAPDSYLIDTEPEAGQVVLSHLSMYKIGRDADVTETGGEERLLSLVGPRSEAIVGSPLGNEHCTGRSRSPGRVPRDQDRSRRRPDRPGRSRGGGGGALRSAGAEPIEARAAEISRVESGRPRLGREIEPDRTMPQEAGINERAVSFTKAATSARRPSRACTTRESRTGTCACSPRSELPGERRWSLDGRELGTVGTSVLSPARGPLALADPAARGRTRRRGGGGSPRRQDAYALVEETPENEGERGATPRPGRSASGQAAGDVVPLLGGPVADPEEPEARHAPEPDGVAAPFDPSGDHLAAKPPAALGAPAEPGPDLRSLLAEAE